MNLPMAATLPMVPEQVPQPALSQGEITSLQAEVRELASERRAVILAHNYQVPEVQDVAHYVGDSLGLSRRAAVADGEAIVFCGVHFMAETGSILCPEKTVLIPDLDAGCSLAASIDAEQLAGWRQEFPRGGRRDVREHDRRGQGADRLLLHLGQRRRRRAPHLRHARRGHGDPVRPRTCGWAPTSRRSWGGACTYGTASATCMQAYALRHRRHPRRPPGADFLIHPECGCSTSVMEYVAAGDISSEGVHMLSTGGMLCYGRGEAERAARAAPARPSSRDRDRDAPPAADGSAGCRVHTRPIRRPRACS